MSDIKHTPGPWVVTPVRSGFCIESEHEVIVDTKDFEGRYGTIDTEANARLIAAAPDLLEALERCFEIMNNGGRWSIPDQNQAAAAIAKAKGEQP